MNIRDLSLLERLPASLDELIEACKPAGTVSTRCPHLSADATRKAMALRGAVDKLRQALDAAGPPPTFSKPKAPLYMRINSHTEIQEIARLVSYDGCLEDDLFSLTKRLAADLGSDCVREAMAELTWTHRESRWVRLRPEVLRSCRVLVGPPPGDPDYELYWSDRGGVPIPRTPANPRREQAKPQRLKPAQKPRIKKRKIA